MFSRRQVAQLQLILAFSIALSACGSLLGKQATPTAAPPTALPVPASATPPALAATVNGEGITAAEYTAELARYEAAQTALGKKVSDQDAGKAVLEDLIAQVLLEQAAKAGGFQISDSALQSKLDALAKQLGGPDKLSSWESAHGYSADTFRLALQRDSDAAWMRDKIIQAVPLTADQVHVQQILLYNADVAQSVLQQLKGGADFNTLAASYDPATRGDLGWFPKGYLLDPQVEAAAFSLPVGQTSDVIQTNVGFDIIKVLEHDAQHALSPDAYLVMQEQALKGWLVQHRAQALVVLAPS